MHPEIAGSAAPFQAEEHAPVRRARFRTRLIFSLLPAVVCLLYLPLCLPAQQVAGAVVQADTAYASLLERGRQAESSGVLREAKSLFESAIRLQPDRPEGWYEAGVLSGRLGNFPEAKLQLRQCVERDPRSAKAHYMLGVALVADPGNTIDWAAAIQEFRAAAALRQPYPEAEARLTQGLLATGDVAEALKVARAATAAQPASAVLNYQLGMAFTAAGQNAEALDAFRRAVSADPHSSDAVTALTRGLLAAGKPAEAALPLTMLLRANPDLQPPHYLLARALRQMGKAEAANEEMEISTSLLERDPKAVAATQKSNDGLRLAGQGDLPGALAALADAVRTRPDYGVAHYNLALVLADANRRTEARQQMLQAISLLPGSAKPVFGMSRLEQLEGNPGAAKCDMRIASMLSPDDPRIAAALKSLSNPGKSPDTCDSSPTEWRDTVPAHLALGRRLRAQADAIGAAGQFLRVLSLEPANIAARTELAEAYWEAGATQYATIETRKLRLMQQPEEQPAPAIAGHP